MTKALAEATESSCRQANTPLSSSSLPRANIRAVGLRLGPIGVLEKHLPWIRVVGEDWLSRFYKATEWGPYEMNARSILVSAVASVALFLAVCSGGVTLEAVGEGGLVVTVHSIVDPGGRRKEDVSVMRFKAGEKTAELLRRVRVSLTGYANQTPQPSEYRVGVTRFTGNCFPAKPVDQKCNAHQSSSRETKADTLGLVLAALREVLPQGGVIGPRLR